MTTWITETEYRRSGGAYGTGLAINVAFLQEIKEDNVEFRSVLDRTGKLLASVELPDAPVVSQQLGRLRDALETYFAVETFYGYFDNAEVNNQAVSHHAGTLLKQHEVLFVQLNDIVEKCEQIVYHECADDVTVRTISDEYLRFAKSLQDHEREEMGLIMRYYNEDIGVGD